MGRVFSWCKVADKRVPQLEAFDLVYAGLKERILTQPSIVAAIACGSVVRGDHTIRSDLDVAVIYDHHQAEDAFSWMRTEHARAERVDVPLSFLPCDTSIVRTRMHHLGGSFVRHLQKSVEHGGNVKGDIFPMIAPSQSEREELDAYLRMKLYKLQSLYVEAPDFDEEREARFLQKVIEAPLHVARKVLAHRNWMHGDSKAAVLTHYSAAMPDELSSQLGHFVRMDEWYTVFLRDQVERSDRDSYIHALFTLRKLPASVIEFVRQNLVYIAKAL